ncbi:MAG: ATP-dependent DNA helicase [Oligoflexus sp.]|nr:ATP-dependent DNA helicase [Oligoflexus sp.]
MDKAKARKKIKKVAVRDFALPLSRSGDLGTSSYFALPIDLGQDIHVLIQARLSQEFPNYRAEIALQTVLRGESGELRVSGRCDGIFDQETPIIEEIKSTFGLPQLKRAIGQQFDHPYILQTKMYGYIYYLRRGVRPELRLRLVDSRTLKEDLLDIPFDPQDFGRWVNERQKQIEQSLERYAQLVKKRKRLAARLFFPFATKRANQEELVERVRESLAAKRLLLLQAPTGLGKTAGVLFPSLVHALSLGSPVLYVAPKNSQFKAAIDLGKMFQKRRIPLKVLVLTSKAKACSQDTLHCQSSSCPYAIGYYEKVGAAGLADRDEKKHLWDYRYFQKLGDQFEICPYEIAMERVRAADLIICDYNYVFSPRANFLDRYLDPILPMRKPVLVIDEAHNLYERVIENYSPEIRLSVLEAFLANAVANADDTFKILLQKSIILLKNVSRAGSAKVKIDADAIKEILALSLILMTSRWGGEGLPTVEDPLFQFYSQWFELNEMIGISQETVPLIYKREDGDEILKAQCIDTSAIIAPLYANFQGVIAFSATLKPFEFYRHMNGFGTELSDCIEFQSPFPRAHKKIMIIPQVQTNYRERQKHYQRIATIIERVISLKAGPYLVFFSSYQFLRAVQAELLLGKDVELYAQTGALSGNSLQTVTDLLEKDTGTQLVLAVQGGSLAEGIDFRGLGLRGVFIVGPAVPSASFERKLMQEHFEKLCGNGAAFAYVYPSMTKSIQAAGRIVRDESERGIIILMDPRFLEKDYAETMPIDWFETSARELVPKQILSEIERFWAEGNKEELQHEGENETGREASCHEDVLQQ